MFVSRKYKIMVNFICHNFYLVFQTKDGKTYLAYGWEDAKERGQTGLGDTTLRRLYQLERR